MAIASKGPTSLEGAAYHAVGMSSTDSTVNPFMIAQRQLDEAARILELDRATHDMLRWPLRELHVTLPVKMDDGNFKVFHGFRVQYNDARGPCKGGIRFHPDETVDTVRALAAVLPLGTLVAVGHEPTLRGLAVSLLGQRTFGLRIEPGACVVLAVDALPPRARAELIGLWDTAALRILGGDSRPPS